MPMDGVAACTRAQEVRHPVARTASDLPSCLSGTMYHGIDGDGSARLTFQSESEQFCALCATGRNC